MYNYRLNYIREALGFIKEAQKAPRFKSVELPDGSVPRFNNPLDNTGTMTKVEEAYRGGATLSEIRRGFRVEPMEFKEIDAAITNLKHNSSAQELNAIQERIDKLDPEYGAWCRARLAERIETLRPEHGIATAQQASEERVATDRAHTAARAEIVAIRAKMNNYEQLTPQDLTVIQDNPEAFRPVIGNYNANNPYGIQLDPITGKVKDSFFDYLPEDGVTTQGKARRAQEKMDELKPEANDGEAVLPKFEPEHTKTPPGDRPFESFHDATHDPVNEGLPEGTVRGDADSSGFSETRGQRASIAKRKEALAKEQDIVNKLIVARDAYRGKIRNIQRAMLEGRIDSTAAAQQFGEARDALVAAQTKFDADIGQLRQDYSDIKFKTKKPTFQESYTNLDDILHQEHILDAIQTPGKHGIIIENTGEIKIPLTEAQALDLRHPAQAPDGLWGTTTLPADSSIVKDGNKYYLVLDRNFQAPGSGPERHLQGTFDESSFFYKKQLQHRRQLEAQKRLAEIRGDADEARRFGDQLNELDKRMPGYITEYNDLVNDLPNRRLSWYGDEYGIPLVGGPNDPILKFLSAEELGKMGYELRSPLVGGSSVGYAPGPAQYLAPNRITLEGGIAGAGAASIPNAKIEFDPLTGSHYIRYNAQQPDEGINTLLKNNPNVTYDPINGRLILPEDSKVVRAAREIEEVAAKQRAQSAGRAKSTLDTFLWLPKNHPGGTAIGGGVLGTGIVGAVGANYLNNVFNEEVQRRTDAQLEPLKSKIRDAVIAENSKLPEDKRLTEEEVTARINLETWRRREEIRGKVEEQLRTDLVVDGKTNYWLSGTTAGMLDSVKDQFFTRPNYGEPEVKLPAAVKPAGPPKEPEDTTTPAPPTTDHALERAKKEEEKVMGKTLSKLPISHTLAGAGIGAGLGGTVGALRYFLENTSHLSDEEKKRRTLMKMVLSGAGIGAGLGGAVGGVADIRHSFITPPELSTPTRS